MTKPTHHHLLQLPPLFSLLWARAKRTGLGFALCPRCFRATPKAAGERFCPNDGASLVCACPACGAGIPSPLARYCSYCGCDLLGMDCAGGGGQ
jgi:hypothetical protein